MNPRFQTSNTPEAARVTIPAPRRSSRTLVLVYGGVISPVVTVGWGLVTMVFFSSLHPLAILIGLFPAMICGAMAYFLCWKTYGELVWERWGHDEIELTGKSITGRRIAPCFPTQIWGTRATATIQGILVPAARAWDPPPRDFERPKTAVVVESTGSRDLRFTLSLPREDAEAIVAFLMSELGARQGRAGAA